VHLPDELRYESRRKGEGREREEEERRRWGGSTKFDVQRV